VQKGRDLLRKKREALAAELFRLARPAVDAREAIAERTESAYPALLEALVAQGRDRVRALAWPVRDVNVEMRGTRVWGMAVADITQRPAFLRTPDARGMAPGSSGPAVNQAAEQFELLTELLLDAAPREMLLRRLGAALARTSRQVRALEQRVAPALRHDIARIRATLEERQRQDLLRLKHVLRRKELERNRRAGA
jgi:V/A-type H+-transporting ATPase subunit D